MKIFFSIIFTFVSLNVFGQSLCNDYLNDIKNNIGNLNLDTPSTKKIYSYGFDIFTNFGPDGESEKRNWDKLFEYKRNFEGYSHKDMEWLYTNRQHQSDEIHNFIKNNIGQSEYIRIKKDTNYAFMTTGEGFIKSDEIYELNKTEALERLEKKLEEFSYLRGSHYYITHINGQSIEEMNDEEIFYIFYFNNNPQKTEFTIHFFNLYNIKKYYGNFKINLDPEYQDKTHLTFEFDFLNYFDLDTANNKVSFDYSYEFYWFDNRIDDISQNYFEKNNNQKFLCIFNLREKIENGYDFWHPQIDIIGRTENINLDEINFVISYSSSKSSTKIKTFYKGFYEKIVNYNLISFPFDKQNIRVPIRVKNINSHDVYLSPSLSTDGPRKLRKYLYNNFLDNEFYLNNYFADYDYEISDVSILSPTFYIIFDLERKSKYYLFKVILPISIILLIISTVFFIPSRQLESRLTLSVVSFLALIAYIFVIDESIPKLSYLTYLDYFTIYSFILAAIPNLWAIFSYRYFMKNNQEHFLNKYLPYSHFSFFLITAFIILHFLVKGNLNNTGSYLSFLF